MCAIRVHGLQCGPNALCPQPVQLLDLVVPQLHSRVDADLDVGADGDQERQDRQSGGVIRIHHHTHEEVVLVRSLAKQVEHGLEQHQGPLLHRNDEGEGGVAGRDWAVHTAATAATATTCSTVAGGREGKWLRQVLLAAVAGRSCTTQKVANNKDKMK